MSMTGTPWELTQWLHEQPQDKLFTVREHRKRRSLTQNAYYWVLVNRLARVMGMSDTVVHEWMLRDYGACEVFSVRADVPYEGYFPYCEKVGTGVVNGRLFNHVKVYKGSSNMDSKEFSRLLEGVRYECELQGIDVMTPSEVASMAFVENYGGDQ